MTEEKFYEDLSLVRKRVRIAVAALAVLFFAVLFAYWKLQIVDHAKFHRLAESNRLRERAIPSSRGLILDRNGVILAENTAGFRVSLIRENMAERDVSVKSVSRLLEMDEEVLLDRMEKFSGRPSFEPGVIKDNLTLEEVARIESRQKEFPELLVEIEARRSYPFGPAGAHVLGYLQEITEGEIRNSPSGRRRLGDMVGRTGIERHYQDLLAGRDGKALHVVDSHGRSREIMEKDEPIKGTNIRLSLDIDLQRKAEQLLEGREGSAVVMDVETGDILCLASFPTFDPNRFISRFSPEEWSELMEDPSFPLENRAIRGLYAPGSIFKLVMAAAGLESGLINETMTYACAGSIQLYGNVFHCWFRPGHGALNLAEAIRQSCNVYFYHIGRRMDVDDIARFAGLLGLGRLTGIDLPGEKEGLVPTVEWKKRTSGAPWYPGETISVSIGQGPLLVTPVQMAAMTAVIANRGRKVRPRIKLSDGDESRGRPAADLEDVVVLDIKRTTFEKIVEGMWRSVNAQGTGRGAAVEGFDVCGKTGSTQVISRERAEILARRGRIVKTHSWFSGFAPRRNPRIAVAVLVEHGGMGGETAAPVARELIRLFRDKYD
ncbi:MAG: penicillin-binding protein 2 [Acidobacteriota bacterium]|nr:penicillin-binding protein 2 [Acidobacteriota bacterium]